MMNERLLSTLNTLKLCQQRYPWPCWLRQSICRLFPGHWSNRISLFPLGNHRETIEHRPIGICTCQGELQAIKMRSESNHMYDKIEQHIYVVVKKGDLPSERKSSSSLLDQVACKQHH